MWKFPIFIILATLALVQIAESQMVCTGCPAPLEGKDLKDAENQLKTSLSKIAAGTGPTYNLVEIKSASRQVISGVKYIIKADLSNGANDTETCDIVIISQAWLENGVQVTIDCPSGPEVTMNHSA